ncbi:hsp70-binding protein 1-like [Amphiura filiformis]|uniref:hsp70-binding protein 1-like n=1 Tax=Amphiura filiformis TaxID=82378 RepID=UPI003B2161AE
MASTGGHGSGDDPGDKRPPRNLQDVLKYAIEHTPTTQDEEGGESEGGNHGNQESAAERAEWLSNALSGMYKDEVKEMAEQVAFLKESSKVTEAVEGHEVEGREDLEEKKTEALEYLFDLVQGIDNAKDFLKVGGGDILQLCFSDPSSEVRWRTLDLLAALSQNHPSNQAEFHSMGLIKRLLEVLDSSSEVDMVRIKALYALSCLCRDNDACLSNFVKHDGFSVLMRAMQSDIEKLQIKATFMLQAILISFPQHKDTLHNMGMVHQLVSLLQQEHAITHEQFILALLNLVSGHSGCISDCCQPELQFEELLKSRVEFLKDKEEFMEELEYCQKLMAICFTKNTSSQGMDR